MGQLFHKEGILKSSEGLTACIYILVSKREEIKSEALHATRKVYTLFAIFFILPTKPNFLDT